MSRDCEFCQSEHVALPVWFRKDCLDLFKIGLKHTTRICNYCALRKLHEYRLEEENGKRTSPGSQRINNGGDQS